MSEINSPQHSTADSGESMASAQTGSHSHSGRGAGLLYNVTIPLLLLAVGAGVVFALGSVKPKKRPADDLSHAGRLRALPPVRVVDVRSLQSQDERLVLSVDGSVVPFHEARIASEVAGQIQFKSDVCEAGSFVTKGQLLMRIDPIDYELDVQRLTRLQEQEYQALGEVDQEMINVKRLIDVAKQDVTIQMRDVARQEALPEGFRSEGELDQAKRGLLQATQQSVTYENQLDLMRKRRLRLEASERLAGTQLKVAEVNLARTEIRAPMDGVIVNEDAELNTFVARGTTVVTIEDISKVEVATNLRMDQLHWILDQADKTESAENAGSISRGYNLPETPAVIEYEIAGRDGDVYRWNGRLLSYDGIGLDPATRTVPVRVVVDNPRRYVDANGEQRTTEGPAPLVRGMYVRVKLLIQPRTPLVVIPAQALKPGNRVWEFVPDDSVLDVSNSSDESTVEKNAANPIQESVPDETTSDPESSPFDPSKWCPGRVVVRRSVLPVDALSVVGSDESDTEGVTKERHWVCEARNGLLTGKSFVVVSPLGTVDDETLSARASSESISADVPSERQVSTESSREHLQ